MLIQSLYFTLALSPFLFFVLGSFNFANMTYLLEIRVFMFMKLQDGEYKSF